VTTAYKIQWFRCSKCGTGFQNFYQDSPTLMQIDPICYNCKKEEGSENTRLYNIDILAELFCLTGEIYRRYG